MLGYFTPALADDPHDPDGSIDILIGSALVWEFIEGPRIATPAPGLYLIPSKLGLMLAGESSHESLSKVPAMLCITESPCQFPGSLETKLETNYPDIVIAGDPTENDSPDGADVRFSDFGDADRRLVSIRNERCGILTPVRAPGIAIQPQPFISSRIQPITLAFPLFLLLLLFSAIIPLHQHYIQLFHYYAVPIIKLFHYYPALLFSSYSAIIQLSYCQAIPLLSSSRLSPEVRRVSASWTTHELEPLSLLHLHTSDVGCKAGKLNSRDCFIQGLGQYLSSDLVIVNLYNIIMYSIANPHRYRQFGQNGFQRAILVGDFPCFDQVAQQLFLPDTIAGRECGGS